MTGVASVAGRAWTWNARSVNGKGLDVRCRVPGGLEWLEPVARERAGRIMTRGSISLSLSLDCGEGAGVTVNHAVLDDLVDVVEKRTGPPSAAVLAGLLAVPGVVTVGGRVETAAMADELTADLESVLGRLAASRLGEGASLAGIMGGLLDDIDSLVALARDEARGEPERMRCALDEKVRDLLEDPVINEARFAQEVVLLVSRADAREEIDRLALHGAAVRDLLEQVSPGRQLGFYCQELLREANTLSSKSQSTPLTNAALDLKVAIDRLREQAQNVE